MINETLVELSRWQFAITALFHFLFVPLTIGMTWILFIMEAVYVMTGRVIYRDMTKFWGKRVCDQLRHRCRHRSNNGV